MLREIHMLEFPEDTKTLENSRVGWYETMHKGLSRKQEQVFFHIRPTASKEAIMAALHIIAANK